jgi:ubiquinone/menaquinone biosynthesis C-methylase UbiE
MADFLNINDIVSRLDLKESMNAAEFGCGSADFAIALAKKIGKGKVYALDIQEEKLSALKSKLALQKINNVFAILCDLEEPEGSTLQSNYLDVVVIPNLLFQAENKNAILQEAKRILKSGGQLLVVDWLQESLFNAKENLISPDEVKKMAKELGFSLKKEFESGSYHYVLLFTK